MIARSHDNIKMQKVWGGPCDGTEVLPPKPEHLQSHVCIGIPAPPEHNSLVQPVWCVYMWEPKKQRWGWVDFYQAPSTQVLEMVLRKLTDDIDLGKGFRGFKN